MPARYRPWEGGDVVAGLLDYLLGVTPDAAGAALSVSPHLPPGWPSVGATGLRLGETRFDVRLEGYAEGQVLTLSRPAGAPWATRVTLHGERPFARLDVGGQAVDVEGAVVSVDVSWPGGDLVVIAAYASER